jgi:Cytidylate kinase-like family
MAVWTIAAQEGTGGERIAAELAASAGIPLLDRQTLALFAHELDPDDLEVEDFEEIEERFGGRLRMLAFSLAITPGLAAAAAVQELQFRHKLPELGRAVIGEAARRPCVILAPAAFAALPEHPGAIHVRLRAPLACRVASYQREHLVDPGCAEKAIKHDDRVKSAWVRSLYHADIDDDRRFTLALDTSRFPTGRLVEILLAAGGVQAALLAT